MNTDDTLAELLELQTQLENEANRLLHAAHGAKQIIKRQPLDAALPELLRNARRTADDAKTTAARLASALTRHADAEHAREMVSRRRWRPSKHCSPGERARARMAKRGCLTGSLDGGV